MTAYSYRKNYKSLARTKIKSNVYIVSSAQRSWSQEEYLFYLTRSNWSYVEIKISLFFVEFLVLPTKNTFLNSFSFDSQQNTIDVHIVVFIYNYLEKQILSKVFRLNFSLNSIDVD